jgi:hypothetical protein
VTTLWGKLALPAQHGLPGPARGAPGPRARSSASGSSGGAGACLWLLYGPALVVAVLYFWAFLDHAWSVVSFPHQVDYGEAPELHRAVLLSELRPIYVDWSHPPYQMANYPPLYPAAAAVGVKLLGIQFFTGRLISLLSTLGTGIAVALVASTLGAGGRGAVVGGLLYFVAHPVWNWGAYQRVDALAVFLELLGVLVFAAGWIRRRRAWAVWATVPLFLAAAYTRQTVAAGAGACYLYLLLLRPKLALAATGAYAVAGLATFGALHAATAGQFGRHIVWGNLNRWDWDTVNHYWQPFWHLLHWLIALAAVAALLSAARRQSQLPLLYGLATAATALTIGKIGSNVNYLLQLCAALALLAGLAVGQVDRLVLRLARGSRLPQQLRPLARLALLGGLGPALWLLAGLQQAYHVPYFAEAGEVTLRQPAQLLDRLRWLQWPLWRLDRWSAPPDDLSTYWRDWYRPNPGPLEREHARAAGQEVAAHAGDVLSEDMSFTVTSGRRIYVQPFEFTQLAEQGEWDQQPLLDDIRNQRFSIVVLRFPLDGDPSWHAQRVNQPMQEAVARAYRPAAAYGDYFIYVPR